MHKIQQTIDNYCEFRYIIIRYKIAGDTNGNGKVNDDDAIYLLYYVYFGEAEYPIK